MHLPSTRPLLLFAVGAAAALAMASTASAGPRVRLDTGQIEGEAAGAAAAFKGIPFAAPPVGEWRWRPPQPAKAWNGVRPATAFGPDCMQGRFRPPGAAPAGTPARAAPSEDCLYVNVWAPAGGRARKLPVMVWIYGGGFFAGAGSSPSTSGEAFARQGVVLVNFNYRVGRFGFFGFPALSREHPDEVKGNYGFMDQVAVLQWVKRNIAAFGGDPDNVTIFGESAGGVSVHNLLTMPMAQGLFHKAIVQSGGARDSILTGRPLARDNFDPNYLTSAETIGVNFARKVGIAGADAAALARLRALSADQILDGGQTAADGKLTATGPILDGKLVVETAETAFKAGRQARVPLIVGANSWDNGGGRIVTPTKEGLFSRFAPHRAEAIAAYDPDGNRDLATLIWQVDDDYVHAEPSRFVANTFVSGGSPTWLYRFSYVATSMREQWKTGAPHASEIPYAFDTLASRYGEAVTPQDQAVAKMTNAYWVNFARTGDPNGPGLPPWPRHEFRKDALFDVRPDGTTLVGPDPRKTRLDLMEQASEAGVRSEAGF